MFGEGHGASIARAGIEEALACRDVLDPAPPRPGPIARAASRLGAVAFPAFSWFAGSHAARSGPRRIDDVAARPAER